MYSHRDSYGSISYTNTYVALNTASVAYDWAVGKQVTVGGQVGIGIWLNSLLGGDSFIMNPAGFLQVRTRWYFDRPYRQRRGYSLRYNSGFFGELALTNHLYVDLPLYNGIGTMNCATRFPRNYRCDAACRFRLSLCRSENRVRLLIARHDAI